MIFVSLILFAISLLCVVSATYYFLSAVIFILRQRYRLCPATIRAQSLEHMRFLILIPAHNEERVLPRLLKSISVIDYPSAFFRSCVICDNCHDSTENIAEEFGSIVLVRRNADQQGKGYAIHFALNCLNIERFDVIIMTDADTVLNKTILQELSMLFMDDKIEAVQCYNGVVNPDETPLTRLISIARALEIMYMDSREFLGLTVHLIGNGMCFRSSTLERCPWTALSIAEDLEYFCLLTANGIKVHYSFLARVFLQEERRLSHAKDQRQRWASGKFQLIVKYVPKILTRFLSKGTILDAEAIMILLVPNPSLLANMILVTFLIALIFDLLLIIKLLSGFSLCLLTFYLVSSFLLVTPTIKTVSSLFLVPIYLLWKGSIDLAAIIGKKRHEWLKTKRQ